MPKDKKKFLMDEDFIDDNSNENVADDNDIDNYYIEEKEKRSNKKGLTLVALVAAAVCVIAIGGLILLAVIDKYTPNGEKISLYEYYGVEEGNDAEDIQAFLIMDGAVTEQAAYFIDEVWYFKKDYVDSAFNDKFYYDEGNEQLIYTTPSKILTIPFDSQSYYVDEQVKKESYVISRHIDGTIYIAVDFVRERADFIYEVRTEPYRIIITTKYGRKEYTAITDGSNIRTEASIKSPILSIGGEPYDWCITGTEGDWTEITTDDCQVGYIRTKELGDAYTVTTSNNYQPPIYTAISKNYKINLVWHAVYSQTDNDEIAALLEGTEGVNTVSPTWYQVMGSDGSLNSFASQEYVDYVHGLGMEVWALVSDFTSVNEEGGWDEYALFAVTENRRGLIANLMTEIETYGYDGLNIDFEKVTQESGIHYVQFLRELSIACRKAGVVLSIDNYVPMSHTAHYDRQEQGEIADYVIVMGYDEHYSGSDEAGSVASLGFVTNGILNTLEMVSADKVINALPFYTRVWMESMDENGNEVLTSKTYSMQGAWDLVNELGLTSIWNEEAGQFIAVGEVEGVNYSVWLEDEKSIEAKMQVVQQNKLSGVAGWSLGMEMPTIWNIINSYNHE